MVKPMQQDDELAGVAATPRRERSNWRRMMPPLLIVAAGLFAYRNSFSGPFILDDLRKIRDNVHIRRLWPLTDTLQETSRPLVQLTLALNYAVGGTNVADYHAVNLMIHLAAALVLYGLVRHTLRREGLRERYGGVADGLAAVAAGWWVVHPLQTEAVTYIIQRGESLMGLLYLLTVYCVTRAADAERPVRWIVGAVTCCALGMATKPVMVTAPFIVLLYDRSFLSGSFTRALRTRGGLYAALAVTWLLLPLCLLNGSADWQTSAGFGWSAEVSPRTYLLTQMVVIVHYLKLVVWPLNLCLDYAWPMARDTGTVLWPAALVVGLGLLTFETLWRAPRLGFLGAWFFVILLPTSSYLPVADAAAEHRMYLPLAALTVLVAVGGYEILARVSRGGPAYYARGIGWASAVAIAGWLACQTFHRNEDYRSALAIWSDTAAKRPNNARAVTEVGTALVELGRLAEGIGYYERATQVQPDYVMAYTDWGVALAMQGRLAEAVGKFSEAVRRNPASAYAHYNLGLALAKQGQAEQAVIEYQLALRIDPTFTKARDRLACLPTSG